MKIELELTPEIEAWAQTASVVNLDHKFRPNEGVEQILDAIQKAKNQIKPGDLVKYKRGKKEYTWFLVDWIDKLGQIVDFNGFPHHKLNCTKATPEEEKLIRPLLEGE